MSTKNTMEKVIGSLVNVSGHTFDMRYDLFFTTERLIAVIIQHPLDRPLGAKSFWKSALLGDVLSGQGGKLEQIKTSQKRRRSLEGMTPDELVSTNPRNFAIPYGEIASAEVTRRLLQWQLRFHLSGPSDKKGIVRFNLSKKQAAEAERLLEMASLSK
jgi:hypothetical protein